MSTNLEQLLTESAANRPAGSNGAGTYAKAAAPSPPYRRSWTYPPQLHGPYLAWTRKVSGSLGSISPPTLRPRPRR